MNTDFHGSILKISFAKNKKDNLLIRVNPSNPCPELDSQKRIWGRGLRSK